MHKILLAVLLMCSTAAYAEGPAKASGDGGGAAMERQKPEMSFEEHKAKKLERIAKHKSCIQGAADDDALKACRGGEKMSFEEKKAKALEHITKAESCVQAATSGEALQACHGGKGKGGGKWGDRRRHKGGGGEGPGGAE